MGDLYNFVFYCHLCLLPTKESYVQVGFGSGNGRWHGRRFRQQVAAGREEMTQGRIRVAVSPGAAGAFRRVSVGRPEGSQVLKA